MSNDKTQIIYTLTDEAPMLATAAFLPLVRSFAAQAGIDVVPCDISVAARILGEFPDYLTDAQKLPNNLDMLGTVECGGWTYACMLANSVGHIWVNGLESEAEHTHARA